MTDKGFIIEQAHDNADTTIIVNEAITRVRIISDDIIGRDMDLLVTSFDNATKSELIHKTRKRKH